MRKRVPGIVFGVNGVQIMSAPHWKQLKNVGEILSLEVVRDGKHMFIDVPGETTFYVNWVFETYA